MSETPGTLSDHERLTRQSAGKEARVGRDGGRLPGHARYPGPGPRVVRARGTMCCAECGCIITAGLQKRHVYYRCTHGRGDGSARPERRTLRMSWRRSRLATHGCWTLTSTA